MDAPERDAAKSAAETTEKKKGKKGQGYRRVLGVTTLIKIGGMALTLVSSIVLARWLGASEYGAYAFASSLIAFLAIPGAMGTERLTVRNIASYLSRSQPALAYGSYLWGNRSVGISSSSLFLVAASCLLWWSDGWPRGAMAQASLIALLLVPAFSLTKQRQATLCGLHQVTAGLFPELLLRPALHLGFVALAWWLAPAQLDAVLATALFGLATLIAYATGNLILKPHLVRHFANVQPRFDSRAWLKSAMPFAIMASIYVIHQKADILMLGWLGTTKDIGIFHVVSRCTDALLVFYNAMQSGFAPSVAKLHASGERVELQKLISRSTRIVTLMTGCAALVLSAGSPWILSIFGAEFREGMAALLILAAAQLLNVALGPSGMVLNMIGGERVMLFSLLASVAVNIGLNFLLVPRFGVTGAAIATATAVVSLGVVLAIAAKRKTGISVTIFRFF